MDCFISGENHAVFVKPRVGIFHSSIYVYIRLYALSLRFRLAPTPWLLTGVWKLPLTLVVENKTERDMFYDAMWRVPLLLLAVCLG